MDKYKVTITPEALQNMNDIYDYICNELLVPVAAMNQYKRISKAILDLNYLPERFRKVFFEPEKSMGLRQMIVDHYSVFYLIEGENVIVTNVLYSASDLKNRLKY